MPPSFTLLDQRFMSLANDLDHISGILIKDYKGIGERKHAANLDAIRDNYRQHSTIPLRATGGNYPTFVHDEAIQVDLSALSNLICKIERAREYHIDSIGRMNAGLNNMIWTGPDAEAFAIMWLRIAGPDSDVQHISDGMLNFLYTVKRARDYYQELPPGLREA